MCYVEPHSFGRCGSWKALSVLFSSEEGRRGYRSWMRAQFDRQERSRVAEQLRWTVRVLAVKQSLRDKLRRLRSRRR